MTTSRMLPTPCGALACALSCVFACAPSAPDGSPSEFYFPDGVDPYCEPTGTPQAASAQGDVANWWSCVDLHPTPPRVWMELRTWNAANGKRRGTLTFEGGGRDTRPLLPAIGSDGWLAALSPGDTTTLWVATPEGVGWWSVQLPAPASTSPGILADDGVLIGDAAGVVHAFTKVGDPLWAVDVGGKPANRLGVAKDGTVFALVRGTTRFELVAIVNAAVKWRAPADVPLASLAILRDGRVVYPTYLGDEGDDPADSSKFRLRAHDPQTGAVAWEVSLPGASHAAVEGPDGSLYLVQSGGGLVQSLHADGSERWRFTDLGDAGQPTVLDNGWVVLGCGDRLCALDSGNGHLAAEFPAGGNGVPNSPLALDGVLTAATGSGHYFVWDVPGASTAKGCWARNGRDNAFSGRVP